LADSIAVELHALGAEVASDVGDAVDIGALRSCLKLTRVVTAVAGTSPTLTLAVQSAPTAAGPWIQEATFAVTSTTGKLDRTIAVTDRFVRLSWTIAGTDDPSFTFQVSGAAHVLYAEPRDIPRTAIHVGAIEDIESDVMAECCLRATAECESALNSSYAMPLVGWGEDLRGHVAARAAYHAMTHRGFNPQSESDQLIMLAGGFSTPDGVKSAAQSFFDSISRGNLKPVGVIDQTPDVFEGAGFVVSDTAR
jgi:hypothetical protein